MTATVGCMFQAILLYEISKCFSNAIQVNQREIGATNWRGKKRGRSETKFRKFISFSATKNISNSLRTVNTCLSVNCGMDREQREERRKTGLQNVNV